MKKIGIYGGAFNPPTLGHTEVITQLLDTKVIDTLILVPDGERDDKDYEISHMHRKKLISLFYKALIKKGYRVKLCLHFFEQTGYTLTYDVDSYFKASFGENIYHIFGTDTALGMPAWTGNPDKFIEKKLKKIFISRSGFLLPENTELENYELIQTQTPDISSTQIRKDIQSGDLSKKYLEDDIYRYIVKHRLYQTI